LAFERDFPPQSDVRRPLGPARLASLLVSPWLAVAFGIAGLAVTLALWRSLRTAEGERIGTLGEAHAQTVARMLGKGMQTRIDVLARLAERRAALLRAGGWEIELDGVRATLWAEPSGKVTWITPPQGNEALAGAALGSSEPERGALERAGRQRGPVLTRSFVPPGGERRFDLFIPVSEGGRLAGFVVGVLPARTLFPALVDADTVPGWAFAVYEGERELYRWGFPAGDRWVGASGATVLDTEWRVRAGPSPAVLDQMRTHLPGAVLAAGALISLLLSLSTGLARAAWRRSRRAEAVEAALRDGEARSRLAAIVDSSDDAIVSETLEGVITSWNGGAERIFGYTAEEMVGQPISLLLAPGREDEERQILGRLARGERVPPLETVRVRKGGRPIDVSVTISPIRDAAGKVVAASKVARDISERKRAEDALARAKETAEAASRELEAFSYSVAHDLRAPLRGIDGFSQALLEDHTAMLDEEGREHLRRVRESAQRMAELIDDLLELSRVTRSELRRERVDLTALAQAAAARLRRAEPDRAVELTVSSGLSGSGDPRLLAIVLENLLGNAWKFTGKRAKARIEFGQSDDNGHSVYYVRDDGVGFDMAYAEQLFGVFQRLHGQREFEGTGIGLATVQRIIRRHGGRVWAEGEVDRGATFYFTLG
jgi:PAS domain S-box-containing protein